MVFNVRAGIFEKIAPTSLHYTRKKGAESIVFQIGIDGYQEFSVCCTSHLEIYTDETDRKEEKDKEFEKTIEPKVTATETER